MDGFASQFYEPYTKWKTQERNGQNIDGMEALKSRGKGTREPPGGRQDRVILEEANLDRSPD